MTLDTATNNQLLLGIDHALRNTGLYYLIIDPVSRTSILAHGTTLSYHRTKYDKNDAMVALCMDLKHIIPPSMSIVSPDHCTAILEQDSRGGYNRYLQGEIRGAIKCRLIDQGWRDFCSYHPMTIKKVFTGSGKAKKEDMMIRARVQCSHLADAMALVYTHLIKGLGWSEQEAENAVIRPST